MEKKIGKDNSGKFDDKSKLNKYTKKNRNFQLE